jgi:WhiB family redox-sensing transcriptional regulator
MELKLAECLGADIDKWYPNIKDEDGVEWIDDGQIFEAFGDTSEFYNEARKVCEICPLKEQCLQRALDNKERHGMFGGHTPLERRRIERRIRRQKRQDRLALEQDNE